MGELEKFSQSQEVRVERDAKKKKKKRRQEREKNKERMLSSIHSLIHSLTFVGYCYMPGIESSTRI